MNRMRLTRAESREQTRQHLLDAALKLIAEKSLAAASVEDIASEAGYTRGAFYSNFSSKNELFLDLLQRLHEKEKQDFDALYSSGTDLEIVRARTLALFSTVHRNRNCAICWGEARLLAARDAEFAERFNAFTQEIHQLLAGYILHFCQLAGQVPQVPVELAAISLTGFMEGIQLLQLSREDQDDALISQALTTHMENVMRMVLGGASPVRLPEPRG
ncbi:TetR/AcrR family transcriptional regulator [Paludibacterium purpuratum]|uniref:TetR family transcriptional regulator n=1 Tax=Paludibacterium purpuratum TaxID=1144873 RepID=A0A4R7B2B1_9NEIS|nr:TetR/AcrR family transcriptional regulator [Paludibacterium purpuratum]TDR77846.1 TetR family transcriptional regulator [Paludibacterium purpuratum]